MKKLIILTKSILKKFKNLNSANFRSQHEVLGMPHDVELLKYVTTHVKKMLNHRIRVVYIHVNVANFHNY